MTRENRCLLHGPTHNSCAPHRLFQLDRIFAVNSDFKEKKFAFIGNVFQIIYHINKWVIRSFYFLKVYSVIEPKTIICTFTMYFSNKDKIRSLNGVFRSFGGKERREFWHFKIKVKEKKSEDIFLLCVDAHF